MPSRLTSTLTIAGLSLAVATSAAAQVNQGPQNLAPGVGAGNVLSAQLAIKGPTTTLCPNQASMTAWVYTDFAGTVTMMFARKGQSVSAPIQVKTVPAPAGRHVAKYTQNINIVAPINAEYRLLVGGGSGMTSNWVPLKATCGIPAGPQNVAPGG